MRPLVQKTREALAKHGMSLAEHFVLCTVGQRAPLERQALAEHTFSLSSGDPRGRFTLVEYLAAVDSCAARGWLVPLGEEAREASRRELEAVPHLEAEREFVERLGVYDFTPTGWDLHGRMLVEVFGFDTRPRRKAGVNLDLDGRRAHVLSLTADGCRAQVEACRERVLGLVGPVRFVEVTDPEPIGAWKPSRFETFPTGFQAFLRWEVPAPAGPEAGPGPEPEPEPAPEPPTPSD